MFFSAEQYPRFASKNTVKFVDKSIPPLYNYYD